MTVILRHAVEADAKHVASLLTELGYPSTEADARDRLIRSLRSATSCVAVAEANGEVIGVINAELIPYFPNGSTICRVTALVVSSRHRSHGLGEKLVAHIAEFAREHGCSGLEVTSSERRIGAHRFYERLGFLKNSFRFFRAL
jgi:predicted N-acetyltransferase YhbS